MTLPVVKKALPTLRICLGLGLFLLITVRLNRNGSSYCQIEFTLIPAEAIIAVKLFLGLPWTLEHSNLLPIFPPSG
ncbi:hypothetical protein EDE11_1382 [Methylomonas methanica]|uniref:Uncharacterized protein n=1 Tax=Methylomonas methanica TaxID=421 RepID=A0ABY2CG91_METMH|nr:hypothetical protein EDE11_1382 [Methylomonas methanica]